VRKDFEHMSEGKKAMYMILEMASGRISSFSRAITSAAKGGQGDVLTQRSELLSLNHSVGKYIRRAKRVNRSSTNTRK